MIDANVKRLDLVNNLVGSENLKNLSKHTFEANCEGLYLYLAASAATWRLGETLFSIDVVTEVNCSRSPRQL